MAEQHEETGTDGPALLDDTPMPPRRRRRFLRNVLLVLLGLLIVAIVGLWSSRERIADNVIARELRSRGIQATYSVERVGGRRQVLRDVVVGDPDRPDLVIEQAEVQVKYRLGFPRIGRLTLVRPRLFGSYRDGKLSFGTLDPLLFTGGPKRQFELPNLDVVLIDGRAQLVTDFGILGAKAEGSGHLQGGFDGTLALAARNLNNAGCQAVMPSVYSRLTIKAKQVFYKGPLRAERLSCPEQGLGANAVAFALDGSLDKDFAGLNTGFSLRSGAVQMATNRLRTLGADGRLAFRDGDLNGRADFNGTGVTSSAVGFATLSGKADLRSRDDFAQIELTGDVEGSGMRLGSGFDGALAGIQRSASETMVGPLMAQFRNALRREERGSRLAAEFDWRKTGALSRINVPQATVIGGSGATLLNLSRLQVATGGTAAPRLSGNFTTGGVGIPRIAGRMERGEDGRSVLRMTMTEYRAGTSSLALPVMMVAQGRDGSLGFAGQARLSGPLPGGFARELSLPVDGNWSSGGGLALFRRCTDIRFASLTYANLTLERRGLRLCPTRGGAIVRSGRGGLQIAAGTPSLDVAGRLGDTPIRIRSGPVGFAYPGALAARSLDVSLGPPATATRFLLNDVKAKIGRNDITGTFAGTDARLFAVPLDLLDASGTWSLRNGRLSIRGGKFRLVDRRADQRFEPLVARNGAMDLFNNRITANALLREPGTGRAVVEADIVHNLANATGHADLTVENLLFDRALQPSTLTRLALGVVANVEGRVDGTGDIDWSPRGVTSTGRFRSESLDLAAAFGPIKGLRGEVVFSDLLGMVTAPNQEVYVAEINPGIVVTDGVIRFELDPGMLLKLHSAVFPFMDGTLTLRPMDFRLGTSEVRRFDLHVDGLNSAKFVERMGIEKYIRSTGIFDGDLPLVFDERGGRIVGGLLTSRPPGGNLAFIADLSKMKLGTIAGFAIGALRSLDYTQMTIGMDGALEGEIATRVRFYGVKQGADAKRNFITERFANLPLQFNVNIRAPFYSLISSLKAVSDPAYIKDPRDLGLLDSKGRPIRNQVVNPSLDAIKPKDIQP